MPPAASVFGEFRWVSRSRSSAPPAMWAAKCSTSWPSGAFPPTRWSRSPRARSMGVEVSFGDKTLKCKALEHYRLLRRRHLPDVGRRRRSRRNGRRRSAPQGAVVIDNSSAWRMDPDVPLIVPEVNADGDRRLPQEEHHRQPELLDRAAGRGAEAAARPREDQARGGGDLSVGVRRRQGRHGRARPPDQGDLSLQDAEPKKFPKQIAFNVIPHIDVFMEDGYTKEEWKMVVETKKILDPKIKLTATCVRVPVFVGHSEAVNIEFENPISADEARDILREAPGCIVIDKREPGGYITPLECAGEDATYISRIREDPTVENGLALWVRVRQSAQGRGAQRRADRRSADQPQADQGEAKAALTAPSFLISSKEHAKAFQLCSERRRQRSNPDALRCSATPVDPAIQRTGRRRRSGELAIRHDFPGPLDRPAITVGWGTPLAQIERRLLSQNRLIARPLETGLIIAPAVLNRGRRRSRRLKAEQGAVVRQRHRGGAPGRRRVSPSSWTSAPPKRRPPVIGRVRCGARRASVNRP